MKYEKKVVNICKTASEFLLLRAASEDSAAGKRREFSASEF